jgi:hypothetical protein
MKKDKAYLQHVLDAISDTEKFIENVRRKTNGEAQSREKYKHIIKREKNGVKETSINLLFTLLPFLLSFFLTL